MTQSLRAFLLVTFRGLCFFVYPHMPESRLPF